MNINNNIKESKNCTETIKWITAFLFLFSSIFGNYFFKSCNLIIKFLVTTCSISLFCLIVLLTKKGKQLLIFIRESKKEIKKIVWPTFKETIQTTIVIVFTTIFMSIILWGLDGIAIYTISCITRLKII